MNRIYIDERKYNQLIDYIDRMQNDTPNSKDITFELEMLMLCLTNFAQYDESLNAMVLTMTEQNKNRLIGFLIDRFFPD